MKNKLKSYYSPGNPDMSIWLWFRRTYTAVQKIRQKELRPYKISIPESAVLFVVKESKNSITPTEISRQLLLDIHSISQLLVRMEKRGLVKRVRDFPKKNMIRVSLTRRGSEIQSIIENGYSIVNIMSVLSEREKKQFKSCLDKIRLEAMTNLQR